MTNTNQKKENKIMNKELLEVSLRLGEAMKLHPLEALHRCGLLNDGMEKRLYVWLMEIAPCPDSLLEFLELVAENPQRNDLKRSTWFTGADRGDPDLHLKICGDSSNGYQNPWGIPLGKMVVTASMFKTKRGKTSDSDERKIFYDWLCKNSCNPHKFVMKVDILRAFKNKYKADVINGILDDLLKGGFIAQKAGEGKGRRPVLYAAIYGKTIKIEDKKPIEEPPEVFEIPQGERTIFHAPLLDFKVGQFMDIFEDFEYEEACKDIAQLKKERGWKFKIEYEKPRGKIKRISGPNDELRWNELYNIKGDSYLHLENLDDFQSACNEAEILTKTKDMKFRIVPWDGSHGEIWRVDNAVSI